MAKLVPSQGAERETFGGSRCLGNRGKRILMSGFRKWRWKILLALCVAIGLGVGGAIIVPRRVEIERANACICTLRFLDSAKQIWMVENNKRPEDIPMWSDIQPYMGCGDVTPPTCPDGGTYTLGAVEMKPRCSHPGHELP